MPPERGVLGRRGRDELVQQVVATASRAAWSPSSPADKQGAIHRGPGRQQAKNEPTAGGAGHRRRSVLDGYLTERVPRIGGKNDRLRFDPPPTANADLVINAVLWLSGRADLIGAGPVILPPVRPVPKGQMVAIYSLVWGILPGVVILSGAAMWMVRRR